MVYKRYYSPFEEPPAKTLYPEHRASQNSVREQPAHTRPHHEAHHGFSLDFLNQIQIDDIIILGLLIVLLMEDRENRDVPTILALGFLFLIEYIER